MKIRFVLPLTAVGLLAGCASSPGSVAPDASKAATAQSAQATGVAATADKQRVRCVNERVTGSHLPQRTCRTIAEWDRLKEEGQRYGRDLQGAQIGPPEPQ